ncbi:hypothetical protein [Gulosibacter hominis]|uniref:hypothetical protein n=1 Tax=Gulosibacter hominis TaxID=2770504 RepID=UPI001918975C|nr:hypothetical protein [Gulosibacter hominis]
MLLIAWIGLFFIMVFPNYGILVGAPLIGLLILCSTLAAILHRPDANIAPGQHTAQPAATDANG